MGFTGKRILLVCSGFSAEDIALQSYSAGATSITVSYVKHRLGVGLPDGIEERPLLESISGSTVSFSDGTASEYDVIIYCTGYLHHFPFLHEELRLHTKNRMVPPLYKGVVFPNNNK